MIAFFTLLTFSLAVLPMPHPIANFHENRLSIGLPWAIGSGALDVLELLGSGLMVALSVSFIFMSWTALRNANQTIEASAAGIIFTDDARRIEARWDQVIQYGSPRGMFKSMFTQKYYVKTEAGDFAIYQFLRDEILLRRILRHWAPKSADVQQSNSQIDILGGEASLWVGGVPGIGSKVHHYRTRTNRVYLGAITFFTLIFFAFPWLLQWEGATQKTSAATFVSVDAIFVSVTLWSWWRYLCARVELDHTGILERSVFGARQLDWTEITSIASGDLLTALSGCGKIVRYWSTIAHFEELNAEIERRAVNSVNKI